MPTVSDLISIQVAIDGSGVMRGGDAATREIERVKARLKQQGDDIERLTKNIGESINTALRYVAGLMGIVLSFEGFRRMVVDVADAGTSLGRFSEAAGVAAGRVGALEQALERTGGAAGDVRSVLAAMRSDITQAQMGGTPPEWMTRLGLEPFRMSATEILRRSPDETLLEVSRRAQGLPPMALKQFLPGLPLSPETLSVLTKPQELQRQLKEIETLGTAPTPEQVGAAERLKEKFATLEQLSTATLRDLVTLMEPLLNKVLDGIKIALEWLDRVERSLIGSGIAPAPASVPAAPPPMIGRRSGFGGFRPSRGGGLSSRGSAAPGRSITNLGPVPEFKRDDAGRVVGGIDRSQFLREIEENPSLITKMASMVKGEVGDTAPSSTKIVQLETAFNRAQSRGHSLQQALLSVSEDPGRGYYAADTYHPVTAAEVERFKRDILEPVLKGSDLSSQPGKGAMTGNASAGVAARQFARGTPGYTLPAARGTSESYFREGPFRYPLKRIDAPLSAIPNVATGAAAAAMAPGPENRTINNETSAVVNHVTVNTSATDAAGIAKDVKQEIGRQLSMPQPDAEAARHQQVDNYVDYLKRKYAPDMLNEKAR